MVFLQLEKIPCIELILIIINNINQQIILPTNHLSIIITIPILSVLNCTESWREEPESREVASGWEAVLGWCPRVP